MKKFLRQVREIYRPLQVSILVVLGFIAAAQAMNLIAPYLYSKIIDSLVGKAPMSQAITFAVVSLTVTLFRGTVLRWFREQYEIDHVDFAIPQRTQEVTLQRMFGFSIGQHTSENSGVKQSISNRGETALKQMMDLLIFSALPIVVEITILTCVLFYWSPLVGSIVLICILIYTGSVWYLNNSFRGEFKKMEKSFIQDSRFKREVVDNIGLVIAQGQEDRAQDECEKSLIQSNALAAGIWKRFVTFAVLRDSIPVIGRFSVLLVAIHGVVNNYYTIGELTMFIAWTGNSLSSLGELSPIHRRLIQGYTSTKRYFDMLDIEPEITEVPNPIRPEKFVGRIEFKGVTFRYTRRDAPGYLDDEEVEQPKTEDEVEVGPALDDVSFVIEPGQTIAFVGESGAGKSTLIQALVRAKDPEKGQIIVDNNDLRLLDLKHYRHSIGIVDQSVSLFDQTLRYNITYGLNSNRETVGDHELREVAKMACIDRFWPRLENGFETLIGERGVKLSGGERQRVGIARALVKNPDILIFDEATSNLDSENESLIQESIEKASKGRTTIIIAHRFSTIRKVDKIFVFDKGQLVGQGSHVELAHKCEAYQRLIRNQKI